jgi:hypothetical protein
MESYSKKLKDSKKLVENKSPTKAVGSLSADISKLRRRRFVQIVEALARLRDIQYQDDSAAGLVRHANKVLALNLPSNLLRAAAIFVDYFQGFPPQRRSFMPPAWVTAKKLLPESQRGSLVCSGLDNLEDLEEGDAVVLTRDVAEHHLIAGMAGIIKHIVDQKEDGNFQVEFGELEESSTVEIIAPGSWLRPPRPGDMLDYFRI